MGETLAMRVQLGLLVLILGSIGLAGRWQPARPLVHSFTFIDCAGCHEHWTFQLQVRSDSTMTNWRAVGHWDERVVFREGQWTTDEWNRLVGELERAGLGDLKNFEAYYSTRHLKVDQKIDLRYPPFDLNREFDEKLERGPIGELNRQLYAQARRKLEADWCTRSYSLKVVPAEPVVKLLKVGLRDVVWVGLPEAVLGELREAVLKQTSERSFTVYASPAVHQFFARNLLPLLDRRFPKPLP
jgi:hypothetical protein